jgi:hypothetical protein
MKDHVATGLSFQDMVAELPFEGAELNEPERRARQKSKSRMLEKKR